MPLDWDILDAEERAQVVLDSVEGLYDNDITTLLEDWKQGYFDEGDVSLADSLSHLTQMAQDCVARRVGLPDSRARARANLARKGLLK